MRLGLRTPFFGMPEDLALLPESERERFERELPPVELADQVLAELHPDAEVIRPQVGEFGTELPLGFMRHDGENRTQRRAAVATWAPPKVENAPTRRALLEQRQRQRRGKLDIETRRLQRKAIK